ncbi:MAG: sulfatase-like hydrolase/transferase, partial [Planctomycetota bacterium]|nr:sulfatase-like hydrolase/transferase [Planctomycetota bacterium]
MMLDRWKWALVIWCCVLPVWGDVRSVVAQQETNGSPNVVLIITDDQGYGDIGFHGNEMIQTPELDALASQSFRLTNFHVDPTCAETRSALMTGQYSCRVGVWHTIMGRSLLNPKA